MSVPPTDTRAKEIWSAMRGIYDSYLNGDPSGANTHIAEEVTLWDSEHEQLLTSRAALDELRAARPTIAEDSPARVIAIETGEPVIDIWGDTALCRHTFSVLFADPTLPAERVRNTSVWREWGGKWLMLHNHEDVLYNLPHTASTDKEIAP